MRGVWYSYDGQVHVLKNVELEFSEPGIYVVLGPNGAGKTTLLKVSSLILKPARGAVIVDGADFWELSEEEKERVRRSVTYVHDKPIIIRGSVRENITIGMKIRREVDEELVDYYIKRYNLASVQRMPASRLSAGQAKAVSIVRALVLRPQLLALDEPFAFLDDLRAQTLVEDIINMVSKGGRVLIATHYMYGRLSNIANYLVELLSGEVRRFTKLR